MKWAINRCRFNLGIMSGNSGSGKSGDTVIPGPVIRGPVNWGSTEISQ